MKCEIHAGNLDTLRVQSSKYYNLFYLLYFRQNVLKIMNQSVNQKRPGVMVPIPQYPLYSATLAEFNMHQIGYYLDEAKGWGLDVNELQRAVDDAKSVSAPRAIVVINPGNPTGQVLSRENIEEIIRFAHREGLFILADEVYQVRPGMKPLNFWKYLRYLY